MHDAGFTDGLVQCQLNTVLVDIIREAESSREAVNSVVDGLGSIDVPVESFAVRVVRG